jgi:hypothetical protein
MARVYATEADYADWIGEATAPAGTGVLLAQATRMLEGRVFRMCVYDVDEAGLPTHALVQAAFRDAVCAQVAWWEEVGDSTGAAGVGWSTVELGSARLGRSTTAVSGEDSPARQVAPQVGDVLQAPDLTPEVIRIGAVSTL